MAIEAGTKFITYSPDLDLKEKRSSGPNSKTKVYTIEEISSAAKGEYLEVDILKGVPATSGILGMGTVPVTLLGNLPANSYYTNVSIILEYSHVTTAYTVATAKEFITYSDSANYGAALSHLITGAESIYVELSGGAYDAGGTNSYVAQSAYGDVSTIDNSILLTTDDSSDPTLGDGTIKAKIWYTIETFG